MITEALLLGAHILLDYLEVLGRNTQTLGRGNVAVPAAKLFLQGVEEGVPVLGPQLDQVVEARRLWVGDADRTHGKRHELVADGLDANTGNHVVADGRLGTRAGEMVQEAREDTGAITTSYTSAISD